MTMAKGDHLTQIRGVWHYKRRVPKGLISIVGKTVIQRSTGKHNRTEAGIIARRFNEETEAFWTSLDGFASAHNDYEATLDHCRSLQLDYRTTDELAAGPLDEIVRRLSVLESRGLLASPPAVEAALGVVDRPKIFLSTLFERFEAMNRADLRTKAPDQIRKWRNPRIKAINNLTALIGNKTLQDITRADALSFREWWQDRVLDGGMDPGSANKDIGYLNRMINALSDHLRLGLEQPFAGLRLKGERHNPRKPFPTTFIRVRLLAPGALDGLNVQARLAVYLMIETGMGPSEVVGLTGATIVLDHEVPHVHLRPKVEADDGRNRELKTGNRERTIPLVGVNLLAAKCIVADFDGFPRYVDNPDNLSATANKYLQERELLPEPGVKLYGLRHSFQDRLGELEPPERINVELMGHKFSRPKYGRGPSLTQKREWLLKMAFDVDQRLPSACLASVEGC